MADVTLNLIYNDNGAKASIDSLYNELLKMEQRQWKINLGQIDTRYISQIEDAAKRFQNAYAMLSAPNGSGLGRTKATFNELEQLIDHLNTKIQSNRLKMLDAFIGGDKGAFDDYGKKIKELNSDLDRVQKAFDRISTSTAVSEFLKLKDSIVEMQKSLYASPEELQKISSTNAHDAAQAFYENLFGSHATFDEVQQIRETNARRSAEAMYRALFDKIIAQEEAKKYAEELSKKSAEEFQERISVANNNIAQGYHQTWRGIQQTVTGAINTMTAVYNTWKSVAEAPLNLTGVSTFASMIESMEGSLLLNQISSNIQQGFSAGLERFDILQTFPNVMKSIGYSSAESSDAMDRLYQSVLGLPTAFSDIVDSAKYFALVLDDLDKATDLAIAANNAFVASGANSQQISAGMRQLQYLIDGTKLRSTQWYSLIRSMPIALREVGKAMGYIDFPSFTADLMANKIATDDLIDALIDVGLHSEKIGTIIDVMKTRVTAAMDNVRNAAARMGDTLLTALDTALRQSGGKGIAENIKGVSSIIDHIAEVGAQWISENGDKLQALIDKFMKIDWESIVPKLFDGLTEFADKGLDNINKFLDRIPEILTTVRQTFNDLENSPLVKFLTGSGSILGGITQTGAGIANIVAGAKLTSAGNAILSGLGTSSNATLLGTISGGSFWTVAKAGLPAIIAAGIMIADKNRLDENESKRQAYLNSPEGQREIKSLRAEGRTYALGVLGGDISQLDKFNNIIDILNERRGESLPHVTFDDYGEYLDLLNNYLEGEFKASEISATWVKRYMQGILDAEVESILSSDIPENIYNAWSKIAEQIEEKLESVGRRSARVQSKLSELQEETLKWSDVTVSEMSGIYGGKDGKGGKYFSEKIEESFGGLYRNTLGDYLETQENAGELINSVNQQIVDAINNLPEGERSAVFEAWSDYLGTIDLGSEESLAQLETMLSEGGDKIVKTFLIPQASLDEVRNKNNEAIKSLREDALIAAGEDLDAEENAIIEEAEKNNAFQVLGEKLIDWSASLNEDVLPEIIHQLSIFKNSTESQIRAMVNHINSLRFYIHPSISVRNLSTVVPQTEPYANGGFAPMGTDTIPAMLTPGEYVQRRAAVEHFGRMFMDRINALDLRGALRSLYGSYANPYATGGFVRSDNRSYRDNHAVVNQVFNSGNASTGFRRASRFVRALG